MQMGGGRMSNRGLMCETESRAYLWLAGHVNPIGNLFCCACPSIRRPHRLAQRIFFLGSWLKQPDSRRVSESGKLSGFLLGVLVLDIR